MSPTEARRSTSLSQIVAIAAVFLWFAIGGTAHFLVPLSFAAVVPPFVPYAVPVVYFTGACELLGAIGLLWPRTRKISAICLVALTVCVTPANVFMWQHAERFPEIPPLLLLLRLPLQIVLVLVILYAGAVLRTSNAR